MSIEQKKNKKQEFIKKISESDFKPYNIIDSNIIWNDPYRFPDEGSTFRPKCINQGCHNPVALFRGIVSDPKGRELRTVCSECHKASYGLKSLRKGIISHKKTYCENHDSHLGFECTSIIHFPGVLELDHIDGNHLNNIPENVRTLCKICHSFKSYLNNDFVSKSKKIQNSEKNSLSSNDKKSDSL
jgi:5-methylcytosine-specific restriction endonuclease McrA